MAGKPGGKDGIPTRYSQAKIGLSLFDLNADIGESRDIKDREPEVSERLVKLGKDFDAKLKASLRKPGRL
tara:strand:- start:449 stop:658 length:210 start_codon:yes stop_codon:yes gene_type:complete